MHDKCRQGQKRLKNQVESIGNQTVCLGKLSGENKKLLVWSVFYIFFCGDSKRSTWDNLSRAKINFSGILGLNDVLGKWRYLHNQLFFQRSLQFSLKTYFVGFSVMEKWSLGTKHKTTLLQHKRNLF